MKIQIEAYDTITYNQIPIETEIERPSKCPRCQTSFAGMPEYAAYINSDTAGNSIYALFFCPACEQCFYVEYDIIDEDTEQTAFAMIYPVSESITSFSDEIQNLSPDFVKIYNQSEKAESSNLSEICGIGYRKALEFLVKDYAILKSPSNSETIKSMPLAKCIKTYVTDDHLKNLLEKSVWIGNDETHYVRKHSDRDYTDIKKFTSAIVYFINMVLVAEDAATIDPA